MVIDTLSEPAPLDPAHEQEELRARVRQSFGIAILAWTVFFSLDIYVVFALGADMALFVLDAVGLVALAGAWLLVPPGASRLRTTVAELVGYGVLALLVTLQALTFGGLDSVYVHGISIIVMYHAVSVPKRWTRSLVITAILVAIYPITFAVAARVDPVAAAAWTSDAALTKFGLNYVFVLATAIIAGMSSHMNWSARRQVVEKDEALRSMRRNLARVAEGAQHGRLTGERLGRYELAEVVGRGATGEVYRARRVNDGREVAVKVLHPHLVHDEQAVVRLHREAQAAARVPGGHAPQVLDVGHEAHQHYVVMEFLRGEDLASFLRRRAPLPAAEALEILGAAARALDAVHTASIVHRDLKPHNVFLADRPGAPRSVVLLDFGTSRLAEGANVTLTRTDAVLGTPGYMAPEQARGEGAIGPAADLFSFGVIAYYALVGERPFAAKQPVVALHEVLHLTPVPPSRLREDLPAALDAVFERALAKEPSRRHGSATELVDAIAAVLPPRLQAMP